jgi:hypothetical protein
VTHHLHLTVRDDSRAPPIPRPPSEDRGYGLALVDALCAGWGVRTVPDGKAVWATLRVWPGAGTSGARSTGRAP